ncbi:MAG TPA: hypothetical protein DCY94_02195 [Firmicutes bacterium]|nr:hypothetical protein [Bacillota bacterium]
MKLEILKKTTFDHDHYGLKFMNRIIVPCMYPITMLESIIEIDNIYSIGGNTIYIFKGYKDGHYVYGLYNSFLNDFVELEYDDIKKQGDNFILNRGKEETFYDSRMGFTDYVLVPSDLEIVEESGKYGLKNQRGVCKIPCAYQKEDLYGISSLSEILPGIFLLYSLSNSKIVGLYDEKEGKLIRGEFTDFDIAKGIVILKNRVLLKEKGIHSKTYLSLYDRTHGKFITGPYHDTEITANDDKTPVFQSGMKIIGTVFILKRGGIHGSGALYDAKTGYLKKNVYCGDFIGTDHKIVLSSGKKRDFIGLYNLKESKLEKYSPVSIENKKSKLNVYLNDDMFELYALDDDPENMIYKYATFYYPVEVFTDFLRITKGQTELIFGRDYTLVAIQSSKNSITELSRHMIELLGIPTDNRGTAYLVNGILSYYRPNLIITLDDYAKRPFICVPKTLVASAEFEYGIGLIEASCEIELDRELEQIDENREEISGTMKKIYDNNKVLQLEYPKLSSREQK